MRFLQLCAKFVHYHCATFRCLLRLSAYPIDSENGHSFTTKRWNMNLRNIGQIIGCRTTTATEDSEAKASVQPSAVAAPSPQIIKNPLSPAVRKKRLHPRQKALLKSMREAQSATGVAPACAADKPRRKTNHYRRVASNGFLSSSSIALSFGLFTALNNIARLHPNPVVKLVGAHTPLAAGLASAYVAQGIRDVFKIVSTEPVSPSLAHDAIAPACLMGASYSYALSTLPKFAPATPAGVAATVLVTATGAGFGGALTELASQKMESDHNRSPSSARKKRPTAPPTTLQVGIGRAITQLPLVSLHRSIAAITTNANGALPQRLIRAVPLLTSVPFVLRRVVAPTSPSSSDTSTESASVDNRRPRSRKKLTRD
ncbi:MAG: hypothetical protein H7315_21875 [Herminiimonas sp.]|nr:hypothetical protein [Herminiimonas sp.]